MCKTFPKLKPNPNTYTNLKLSYIFLRNKMHTLKLSVKILLFFWHQQKIKGILYFEIDIAVYKQKIFIK